MDKYSAVWLSHSSINLFKSCPRAYYLGYLHRDPITGHKVSYTNPSMSLGSAVHEVLESLSVLKVEERFKTSLIERLDSVWPRYHAEKGGFEDQETENRYKTRAQEMLRRVMNNPGPLERKAIKIQGDLPQYWLSEEDSLMLCGKIDWLEYLEGEDSVSILDFKTGKGDESPDSLQLPIYYLLAHNCQKRPVKSASYWYIARDNAPIPKILPDLEQSHNLVMKIGKEMKLARSLNRFKCPQGESGCKHCLPYERILRGEAKFVGQGEYNSDLYMIPSHTGLDLPSQIL